jgi:hypothetical protein
MTISYEGSSLQTYTISRILMAARRTYEKTALTMLDPSSRSLVIFSFEIFLPDSLAAAVTTACANPTSTCKHLQYKRFECVGRERTVFSANPMRSLPSRLRMRNLVSESTHAARSLLMSPTFFAWDCERGESVRGIRGNGRRRTEFPEVLAICCSASNTLLTVKGLGLKSVFCLFLDDCIMA